MSSAKAMPGLMPADRWERISTLVVEALECDEAGRRGFVATACAGDAAVRREVESLLGFAERAETFLDAPAVRAAAAFIAEEDALADVDRRIGPYELGKVIGTGGTGTVYRAHDPRLERTVALKTLSPTFLEDADWVSLLQHEARTASALNHPGILTIYEAGEAGGVYFIASEFVDGETLRARLDRGRMRVGEIVDLARQTAAAVGAAHGAGIVHRDLKPENLMIRPDGYVKVLDFGLATWTDRRSVEEILIARRGEADSTALPILGSVSYMSPEQIQGRSVDPRSDVFSLGVVLYEMLAGRTPFTGETPAGIAAAIQFDSAHPVSNYRRDLPPGLAAIVARALAKDPAERYESAAAFLDVLEEVDTVRSEVAATSAPGVASAERARSRFGVGLGALVLLLALGAALGAAYFGRRAPVPDLVAVEASVGGAAEAYYREGRHTLEQRTEADLRAAIAAFERATVEDPTHAAAWAGQAKAYSLLPNYGAVRPEVARDRARAAAERALELDPRNAEAHAAMGLVLKDHEWDFEAARLRFLDAIRLGGDDASAHQWLAEVYVVLGLPDMASEEMEKARQQDRFSPIIQAEVGWVLYHQRRFVEAVDALHGAREVDPDFSRTHFFLGRALDQLGRFDEAVAAIDTSIRLDGDRALYLASRGYTLARDGRPDEARAILAELEAKAEHEYTSPFAIALLHVGLGELDAAFARLDEAHRRRDSILPYYLSDPQLDPIRADPRFAELVERVLGRSAS